MFPYYKQMSTLVVFLTYWIMVLFSAHQ